MPNINEMRQTVLEVFFNQSFYRTRIDQIKAYGDHDFHKYDIGIFLFWCGVIDFFGGLYGVGINGDVADRNQRDGRVKKLSNGSTFQAFIIRFFVDGKGSEQLSSMVYNVFRNGMAHQLSPKKAGIHWIDDDVLIYYPKPGDAVHLNIKYFSKLTYDAFVGLQDVVSAKQPGNDNSDLIVERIFNVILKAPNGDGIGDDRAIAAELTQLSAINYSIPVMQP